MDDNERTGPDEGRAVVLTSAWRRRVGAEVGPGVGKAVRGSPGPVDEGIDLGDEEAEMPGGEELGWLRRRRRCGRSAMTGLLSAPRDRRTPVKCTLVKLVGQREKAWTARVSLTVG